MRSVLPTFIEGMTLYWCHVTDERNTLSLLFSEVSMVDTLVVVEYLICSLIQGSWLHVLSVTMIDSRSMIARWIVQLIDSGLDDDSQH